MKNNFSKIFIVGFSIVTIATLIIVFFNMRTGYVDEAIGIQSYSDYITIKTDTMVTDRKYPYNRTSIDSILLENYAVFNMKYSDGDSILKFDEYRRLNRRVLETYISTLCDFSNDLFYNRAESWDKNDIKMLNDDIRYLKSNSEWIPESSLDDIEKVSEVISNYYSAKKVVSDASSCSSVDNALTLKNLAKRYSNMYPLIYNESLIRELNNVYPEAKRNVKRHIINKCNRIRFEMERDQSLTDESGYKNVLAEAKKYIDKISTDQEISMAKSELESFYNVLTRQNRYNSTYR